MRIAVISDIHGNLLALQTVLKDIDALQPDAIWCLGDVVGYGPEPQACVELVRQRASLCLTGNHDRAVAGLLPLEDFTPIAGAAIEWHQRCLSPAALEWLAQRPLRLVENGVTLVHGSPRSPVWEYITSADIAAANASYFDTPLCLIGHSHGAIAWRLGQEHWWSRARLLRQLADPLSLEGEDRWLLNPGSVGQPRDGDPRASFAILDLEALTWTWRRLEYDVTAVANAILAAGLPPRLAERLFKGA